MTPLEEARLLLARLRQKWPVDRLTVRFVAMKNYGNTCCSPAGRLTITLQAGAEHMALLDSVCHEYAHAMVAQEWPDDFAHHDERWSARYAACMRVWHQKEHIHHGGTDNGTT